MKIDVRSFVGADPSLLRVSVLGGAGHVVEGRT
jgi:hypothetical protein